MTSPRFTLVASLWWLLPAAIAPDLLDIGYAAAGVCNPLGLRR